MSTAPYGSWPSPITAAALVSGAVGISEVVPDGDAVWWAESRPDEAGRSALMCWREGRAVEVTPPDANVRTRVHEYGGGSWWARRRRRLLRRLRRSAAALDRARWRAGAAHAPSPRCRPASVTPTDGSPTTDDGSSASARPITATAPRPPTTSSPWPPTARCRCRCWPPARTSTPRRVCRPMAVVWFGCSGYTPTCRGTSPSSGSPTSIRPLAPRRMSASWWETAPSRCKSPAGVPTARCGWRPIATSGGTCTSSIRRPAI